LSYVYSTGGAGTYKRSAWVYNKPYTWTKRD